MDQRHLRENRRHGTPQFPLAVYEMDCKPNETILDNHWHDEAEFLWVTSGKAVFQIGLTTFALQAGEGIFIPCGEVHGGYSIDENHCSFKAVVFHMSWLAESKDAIATRFFQPLQRREAAIPPKYDSGSQWGISMLLHLNEIYRLVESGDAAKELRTKSELYLLFADLITNGVWTRRDPATPVDTQTTDRLKSVVNYIENYCGQPLNIPQLASLAGMSAGHFGRAFKAFMRKAPMDYVNHYRIRQAAFLLQNSDLSVAEAAMEVGIDNFSYFSKRFKSVYDCTPSQFRKKFRSL
ncbi:AraC family transcriptional regulator [Cohnella endophytica]|uniref:AraC family transcriptional regulator n=1 Tax=Cohnella endophytica TaxID=2419778 RepID=A0A494Y6J3_9BACL|nr:AraC family transcriptional regulator [Cohnella endophytica]RKP57145.1 AraC family transcriptional regulator [Cohnella endophytica]